MTTGKIYLLKDQLEDVMLVFKGEDPLVIYREGSGWRIAGDWIRYIDYAGLIYYN